MTGRFKYKHLISALLTCLALTSQAHSQVLSIRDARALGEEATVTVSGVLTNGKELDVVRYVQDPTGGLAIYDESKMGESTRGDSITVSGILVDYNGLLEIQPVSSMSIEKQGATLPDPTVLKPSELGEYYEGMLIKIRNATFDQAGSNFMAKSNYSFLADGENGVIRISSDGSPLAGTTIPSGNVDITGILSQYQGTYQLLPRDEEDITASAQIGFASLPELTALSPEGFTLAWETTLDGSTELLYGSSPDLSLGMYLEGSGGRQHSIKVEGRSPSELLYAQAFSVDGEDTARSGVQCIMTQSLSSGQIKAMFNLSVDHSLALETEAAHVNQALDDSIVALINRASESVDFCAYNLHAERLAAIPMALNLAHQRGLRVRVIYDVNQSNAGIAELDPDIGKMPSPVSNFPDYGIMHNKFVVTDANTDDPMKSMVWTGSTNFTTDQMFIDANNVVLIQDQSLALAYQMEFNEMFGSEGATPDPEAARFGPDKTDNTPHHFLVGNTWVDCWFSPSDNTHAKIMEALQSADADLSIATMLITKSDLAQVVADRHSHGVDTRMLVKDKRSCSADALAILLPVLQEDFRTGGEQGMMHHKYAVVDQGLDDSDPLVLTGSHNWSASAQERNDENTLVIHDRDMANQFYQEFAMRYDAGIVSVPEQELSPDTPFRLYPNPANDHVRIQVGKRAGQLVIAEQILIRLMDLSGRVLLERKTEATDTILLQTQDFHDGYYLLVLSYTNGLEVALPLIINTGQ